MNNKVSRRAFVATGTAAVAVATRTFAQGPTVIRRSPAKPVVISSANGNRFKNGGDMTGVEKAWSLITQGSDVLDALKDVKGLCRDDLTPEERQLLNEAHNTLEDCLGTRVTLGGEAGCLFQVRDRLVGFAGFQQDVAQRQVRVDQLGADADARVALLNGLG